MWILPLPHCVIPDSIWNPAKYEKQIIRVYNAPIYHVYIMASQRNGTLYVGMTSNLIKRVYQHKTHGIEGFTKKYRVQLLVYFEETSDVNEAIKREKQLKAWKRDWKLQLIEKDNPNWEDLSGS